MSVNACFDGNDVIDASKVRADELGFDAKTGEWIDMMDKGIIDPTKVTRSAVMNAASISALFITTEAVVTEVPKKEPAMPAGAPGMGGMDY
jgi:chaperonin GroEL